MKCKNCGRKVFRTVVNRAGIETKWRVCANCETVNNFNEIFEDNKDERGAFEYDFEN